MIRKMSLQKKLLILVSIVTLMMMLAIVWFDSYNLQRSVEETYVSQLEGITTAINGRYEESHSVQDVQQIFDYIEYKNVDVLQLTLFGEEEIEASTDRSRIGQPSPEGLLAMLEPGESLVKHLHEEADGIPKVLLTAPLKEDGVTIGAIELLLDVTESMALIQQRTHLILLFGLSMTVMLLVLLWMIIRQMLILPLMTLRKAALSVKQGQPHEELELHASSEINEVASAFNEMVHNLEARYKELQEALDTVQHAQKQLVESEKMVALGSLVAGVSHEINTPIGIGVTAASYLSDKTKEFTALYQDSKMTRSELEAFLKRVQETTYMIETNLTRASELIKSFKQVAVDRSTERKRRFRVKSYLEDVLMSLKPQLKKTRHQVEIHGDDQLELYGDPGVLSQVITNLVMNSVTHAFDEGEAGQMEVHIARQGEQIIMTYTDQGKGMEQEVLSRIFDPFFTTNRSGGGTGLGLHIVYNLVSQSLQGHIACESKPGAGTRFIITLPIEGREGHVHQ